MQKRGKRSEVKARAIVTLTILFFAAIMLLSLAKAPTWVLTETQADFNEGNYTNTSYYPGGYVGMWEELPNNQSDESASGGANMSGNVLLMHLNNDSAYGENDSIIYDFSGTGNNGSMANQPNNATWTTAGKFGSALSFDGVDDYIEVPDSTVFDPNPLTIEFWFYPTSNTSAQVMISKSKYEWAIYYHTDQTIGFAVWYWAGSGHLSYKGTTVVPLNTWTHITMVFKKNDFMRGYINGNFEGEDTTPAGTYNPIYISTGINIGRRVDGLSYFNGTIDEVAIWNRSLSATEISAIYNRSVATHGTYESKVYDANRTVSWKNLTWANNYIDNATLNMTFQVRSDDDNLTWPDYIGPDNTSNSYFTNASLANLALTNLSNAQYFQYKAYFETNDTSYTPELWNVTGGYESVGPTVTLNSPDGTYHNSSTVSFNCSAVGNGNLVNISLYTNTTGTWELNDTNNVTGTSNSTNFTVSGIPDGSHAWNCLAYNDANLSAFASENYTFYVDTTSPQINFGDGTESNNTNFSRSWIFVNVSVNETNEANITFYLYNSTEQVNKTTNSTPGQRTIKWTGLPDEHYYYNVTIYDLAGNSNSTETRTLTLDTTVPNITNMVTIPNATAELDPGITIYVNATLNDTLSGVKNATLYFRKSGDSYNNTEMDYDSSTGIANASFYVSTANNGTWYYNVTIYDYAGNVNSSEDNVSVQYECTWQLSYTLENASSILESTSIIGNITINNTGDVAHYNNNCTLRFKIDETEMVRDGLEFDGTYYLPTLFFSLYAEGVLGDASRIVNVTANFAPIEKENENFVITIDDRDGRSDITQRNISGYLDSLPGGPYLKLHFVDSDNINTKITSITINQSSSANLTAYVKNIGNETANNVTFNWTLPSGFSSSSGALENNLTSLPNKTAAPDNVHYYNLTITTDHTATYGTNYIYVNASCAKNASGCSNRSYNISVKVLCNPDSQCGHGCVYDSTQDNHDPGCYVAPTTVTTAGGGGGGVSFIFKAEATYELIRGKDDIFILPLKNTYSSKTLTNIRVSASGYLAQYIKIEPPENVSANEIGEIKVTIVAPSYFTVGMHNLTFTIQSIAKEKGTADLSRVGKRYVHLAIHELDKGESVNLINKIETYLEEMKKLNLRTGRIQELFDKSLDAINKSDYETVEEIYEESKELAEAAFDSYNIVKDLEEKLNDTSKYSIKTPKTNRLVGLAKSALERGDYLLALERVKDAQLTYIIETKGKFGLIYYIRKNTFEFFLYTLVTLIILTFLYFRTKIEIIKYNLKSLEQEEDTLLGLMRVVQKECFEEKKMSMNEYNDAMLQYEDKLSKAVQKTIELEAAKANLLKFKHRKLELERKRLLDLMKITQEKYLKEGAIETQVYNNKMHSFVSRLSELEENLALQEAKETLRKRKLFWRVFYSVFQPKSKDKKD